MAVESEVLLKVNAVEAANNIKELRAALSDARKAMNEAKIGSEEYNDALAAVEMAQSQLANVTKLGVKDVKDAGESYNSLSRTMAELKKQYHATTNELTRRKLAGEINIINDRLKDMDAEVGVFGRNVGNYARGVAEGFSSIGGAAGSVINPVKGVTAGFQVLSKTPVIAILGLAINLFDKIVQSMKSSEDGSQALARAFDGFKVVADLMTKGLQLLGKGLSYLADGFTTLLKKIGLMNEESENRINLGQREIELEKERRRVTMANADAELEIAKLRAQGSDKINLSAKERLELIKKAAELEQTTYQNNYELAKREYQLIKDKNALLPSSSQELQAEADAYAAMVQAEIAYYNKQREYNSQMAEAFNQAKANVQEVKEDIEDLDDTLMKSMAGGEGEEENALLAWWKETSEEMKAINEETVNAIVENTKWETSQYLNSIKEKEKADKDRATAKEALERHGLKIAANVANAAAEIAGRETAVGKAFAVASATISTYQSAVDAYKSMAGIPIVGPALGAAAAAAAVMSGIANVKSILSVKTDGKTTSMPAISGASVSTYAPAIVQQVPVTRSLTGASEEARLNQIADGVNKPVKAYVVGSEMQGQLLYDQQTEDEASF